MKRLVDCKITTLHENPIYFHLKSNYRSSNLILFDLIKKKFHVAFRDDFQNCYCRRFSVQNVDAIVNNFFQDS